MKKPLNIVYGVEDTPPLGVTLFSGLQHVALIAIRLLFPVLVAREAGLAPERVLDVLGMSMIIMGIACVSSDARTRQAAGPESADAATKTRRLAERRAFVDSRLMSSSVPLQRVAGPRSFTVSPVRTFAPFSSL